MTASMYIMPLAQYVLARIGLGRHAANICSRLLRDCQEFIFIKVHTFEEDPLDRALDFFILSTVLQRVLEE